MDIEQVKLDYVTPGHPVAYGGRNILKKYYGDSLSERQIENILSSIHSYTLHREYHRPRGRNPFYIYYLRQMLQMDLIEMKIWGGVDLTLHNNGVNYLLSTIDCFSRRVWIIPMLRKNTSSSLEAIKSVLGEILEKPPRKAIDSILVDNGTEFLNHQVKDYLQQLNINLINTYSDVKAAIVERSNRTIKNLIFKYMTEKETNTYIDVLPLLLDTYNKRTHRSLGGLSPIEAEMGVNQTHVLEQQINRFEKIRMKNRSKKKNLKIGDVVRIKIRAMNRFNRSFHHQFSIDLFKIHKISNRMPIPMYSVQSLNTHEILKQKFYKEQLQLVLGDEYRVEKILKTRKNGAGKNKQFFVKWIGFNDEHNSWVNESDITKKFEQAQSQP